MHDYQVVKRIQESNVGNNDKYWFCALPGFNEVEFPFIVVSGFESFNLVNVKTGNMQILIDVNIG